MATNPPLDPAWLERAQALLDQHAYADPRKHICSCYDHWSLARVYSFCVHDLATFCERTAEVKDSRERLVRERELRREAERYVQRVGFLLDEAGIPRDGAVVEARVGLLIVERDAATAEVARLRAALERIVDPYPHMHAVAKAADCKLDGVLAGQLADSVAYLRDIAREALADPTRTG